MPNHLCPSAPRGSSLSGVKPQVRILRLKIGRQSHPSAGLFSTRPTVFRAVDEHLAYIRGEIFHSFVRFVVKILLDRPQVNGLLHELKIVRILEQATEQERKN